MRQEFLVGDIGGTKTLLQKGARIQHFDSQKYESLEHILEEFLGKERVEKACFGIAGPIKNNQCQVTNLPWFIDGSKLEKQFGFKKATLLNDIIASAYGLENASTEVINETKSSGNKAIISPGTGLGEAFIINGTPVASEGGHADFAPRNEREIELYRKLKQTRSRVSYEDVLKHGGTELNREDEWFCEILGAEAGNLALKGLTTGGVYVGGGVALKVLKSLKGGAFMRGFTDKGKFSDLMKSIPVFVITDPESVLKGALRFLSFSRK